MVEFYVLMIRRKRLALKDVPEQWREAVRKRLEEE